MDLNELLHEHQVAVMKAAASGDGPARDNHFAKVAEYAERVRALRQVGPVSNAVADNDGPPTIIYGSYTSPASEPPAPVPVEAWEDEGGAVRNPSRAAPADIREKLVRHYHVGPYVYQDLDLAVAEHLRQLAAADRGAA